MFKVKIKQEIVEILPNIKILTYNQVVEKNESI
jgi:hypothetical protein